MTIEVHISKIVLLGRTIDNLAKIVGLSEVEAAERLLSQPTVLENLVEPLKDQSEESE